MAEHYEPKSELRDGMRIDWDANGLAEQPPRGQQRAEFTARSQGLMFRRPAFEHEVEFTGPAALKLFVSSTTEDADLFVAVHLFDPGGAEVLFSTATEPHGPVAQGWLRMSHRELDRGRSLPYRPWHPHAAISPLVPGETYEADVEIWPLSIVVPAGYRIGVSVRGQDYSNNLPGPYQTMFGRELRGSGPYWHELPGDRDRPGYNGQTSLHSEDGQRPYLLLPLIPAHP
jgi:uncharacterized protein